MRALALVVLAACAGDGVVVEVDTNGLDVATVELVISNRVCQHPDNDGDCPSIQGAGFNIALGAAGDIYVRDASAITDNFDGGKAVFELPSDGDKITMAFAIGRADDGTIIGSAVMANTLEPGDGPRRYRVTLDPTEELRMRTKLPDIAAAAQWGDTNQCVGIEPVHSTLDVQRPVFIVPEDDPDCDDRREGEECDPLWFDGISFDEASAAHCVLPRLGDPTGPCLLGHVPTCIENMTSANNPGCLQSPICLPSVVCTSCTALDETCQQGKLRSETGEVRIDCDPPGEPDGNGRTTECGGNNEFTLQPLANIELGVTCQTAQLVEDAELALHSQRGGTYADGNASFEILQVDPSCAIRMKWQGSFPTGELAHTVLVVTVDAGGQSREIWIPINFSPGGSTCNQTGVLCTYVDTGDVDSISQCAQ